MGNRCLETLCESETQEEEAKQFSWDVRRPVDTSLYFVDGLCSGEECVRVSGSLGEQQFTVQNCSGARVYVLDHVNSVTIDNCTDCLLVIAAVKGSVFLRDCRECRVLVGCGQFRTRDCQSLHVLLHCSTQPIIESSTDVIFSCLQLDYPGFDDDLRSAGLCVFSNTWSCIHDFTPVGTGDDANWTLMEHKSHVQRALDQIPPPATCDDPRARVRFHCDVGPIPFSRGQLPSGSNIPDSVLVLFIPSSAFSTLCHSYIMKFHARLLQKEEATLLFSRSLCLSTIQLGRVLPAAELDNLPTTDVQTIGLVYSLLPLSLCLQVRSELSMEEGSSSTLTHITSDTRHLSAFTGYCQSSVAT